MGANIQFEFAVNSLQEGNLNTNEFHTLLQTGNCQLIIIILALKRK